MSRGPKTFEDAIDQIGEKASEAAEDAAPAARDVIGELEREFRKIWTSLQGLSSNVAPGAARAKADAEEKVAQNPWLSIATVGLVAFLIGYLLGGRRSE